MLLHVLLWVIPVSAATTACDGEEVHAMNFAQRQLHSQELKQILNPVKDSAVLLVRHGVKGGTNESMLALASRLMRVHGQFQKSCHDHHWEEALTHKLCASFIRWQRTLEAECDYTNFNDHLNNFNDPPSTSSTSSTPRPRGLDCMCTSLARLIHDCRHHVLPWSHELKASGPSTVCERLREANCEHAHPMGGLCRHQQARHTRKLERQAAKARAKFVSSHQRHKTRSKHKHWQEHASVQAMHQHGQDLARRIKTQGSKIRSNGRN